MYDLKTAIDVIDSVSGFSDDDTSVGQAWITVQAEIIRLNAIVNKLPKTRDGVRVVPGVDMVYSTYRGKMVDIETQDNREAEHSYVLFDQVWACYSSQEAAEAAKENTPNA